MCKYLNIITLALILAVPPTGSALGRPLIPEPPRFRDAAMDLYHATVSAVFARSGVEHPCFQTVTLADKGPEEMLYVNCLGESSGVAAELVHLKAGESIRAKLASGADAMGVKVTRHTYSLTSEESRFFGMVWLQAVLSAKPRGYSLHRRHILDYHFAACDIKTGCIGAMSQNPKPGSVAALLVRMGALLAKATAEKRPSQARAKILLARQLGAKVQRVLSKPKRQHSAGGSCCAKSHNSTDQATSRE